MWGHLDSSAICLLPKASATSSSPLERTSRRFITEPAAGTMTRVPDRSAGRTPCWSRVSHARPELCAFSVATETPSPSTRRPCPVYACRRQRGADIVAPGRIPRKVQEVCARDGYQVDLQKRLPYRVHSLTERARGEGCPSDIMPLVQIQRQIHFRQAAEEAEAGRPSSSTADFVPGMLVQGRLSGGASPPYQARLRGHCGGTRALSRRNRSRRRHRGRLRPGGCRCFRRSSRRRLRSRWGRPC